jgi:hypothetical protein
VSNLISPESSTGSTDVRSQVHNSEPLRTEMMQLQGKGYVDVPVENALGHSEGTSIFSPHACLRIT